MSSPVLPMTSSFDPNTSNPGTLSRGKRRQKQECSVAWVPSFQKPQGLVFQKPVPEAPLSRQESILARVGSCIWRAVQSLNANFLTCISPIVYKDLRNQGIRWEVWALHGFLALLFLNPKLTAQPWGQMINQGTERTEWVLVSNSGIFLRTLPWRFQQ